MELDGGLVVVVAARYRLVTAIRREVRGDMVDRASCWESNTSLSNHGSGSVRGGSDVDVSHIRIVVKN